MLITVQNLTDSVLSTDVGSIEPRQSRSQSVSPEMGYKISESLKTLTDAGRCLVTIDYAEPDRLDTLEPAQATNETQGPVDLYVDVSGSDANPGTQLRPLRTIQAALDKVPKSIRHPVMIRVGAGTFDGMVLEGFTFDALPGYLTILGTFVTPTIASGPTSGAVTSSTAGLYNTFGTVTVTGAGWTVNNLAGKLVKMVAGSSVIHRVIDSNTADTITLVGLGSASVQSFELLEQATVLTNPPARATYVVYNQSNSTSNYTCTVACPGTSDSNFNSVASSDPYSTARITFDGFSFVRSGGTGFGYALGYQSPFFVVRCKFRPHTTSSTCIGTSTRGSPYIAASVCMFDLSAVAGSVGFFGQGHVSNCKFVGTGSAGTAVIQNLSGNRGKCVVQHCSATGLGTALGIGKYVEGDFAHTNISSCTTGVETFGLTAMTNMSISSCGTGIKANALSSTGYPLVDLNSVAGTSNTTAIVVTNGARVYFDSSTSITGTTEVSVDGASTTWAAIRLLTPKYYTDTTVAITGSKVWTR